MTEGKDKTGLLDLMRQKVMELATQLRQRNGDNVEAFCNEVLSSVAQTGHGEDATMWAFMEALQTIDEELKAYLQPLVAGYLIDNGAEYVIECKDSHVERQRFLNNFKYDSEYYRAKRRINEYIEYHKGLARIRRVYKRGENGRLERVGFGIARNTTDERILVPFLYGELLIAVDKIIKVGEYRQRIKNYLSIWFEEWQRTPQTEPKKPQQPPKKPQQLPQELQTDEAKKWLQVAIDGGLLNEDYTTTDAVATKRLKALLAEILAENIGLRGKYKYFAPIWGVTADQLRKGRSGTKEAGGATGQNAIFRAFPDATKRK